MNAQVLQAPKQRPVLTKVETPLAAPGEVVIDVLAAGVNHRDLYITQGLYPAVKTPVVLGSDAVGMLEGRRVLVQPGLNWGDDESHQAEDYEVLGMPRNGTFAEQLAVPLDNVFDCPDYLSNEEAAALPLAGLTAYRALFTRAAAKAGDTVLVTGAGGGVATFAIQFAVAAGCAVYVTSSSEAKIAFAKTLGAQGGVRYTDEEWVAQLRKQTLGFDAVVDGAGGAGLAALVKLMNPSGRVAFYGGTTGNIPNLNPQLMFWRQLTLAGSTMGSPREFGKMLAFCSEHSIRPVVDSVRPLAELNAALDRMQAGAQQGKLVLA